MSKRHDLSWLSAYLDGELQPKQAEQIVDALARSRRLRRVLRRLQRSRNALSQLRSIDTHPQPSMETDLTVSTNHHDDGDPSDQLNEQLEQASAEPTAGGLLKALPIMKAPSNALAQCMERIRQDEHFLKTVLPTDANSSLSVSETGPPLEATPAGSSTGSERSAGGSRPRKKSRRAWLSAYLDGEVTRKERRLIERKLARSMSWRIELNRINQVQHMLARLPMIKPELQQVDQWIDWTIDRERARLAREESLGRKSRRLFAGSMMLATAVMLLIGLFTMTPYLHQFLPFRTIEQQDSPVAVGPEPEIGSKAIPPVMPKQEKQTAPSLVVQSDMTPPQVDRKEIDRLEKEEQSQRRDLPMVPADRAVIDALNGLARAKPNELDKLAIMLDCKDAKMTYDRIRASLIKLSIDLPAPQERNDESLVINVVGTPGDVKTLMGELSKLEQLTGSIASADLIYPQIPKESIDPKVNPSALVFDQTPKVPYANMLPLSKEQVKFLMEHSGKQPPQPNLGDRAPAGNDSAKGSPAAPPAEKTPAPVPPPAMVSVKIVLK